ncbi:hypothetical protein EC957_001876 [Mortierella hygrophila]|uniref:Fibronectin type-III domain-containing protein n=1 Tax=Mortierella hygrophila TaxID=979708 RepID=A0A9P6F5Z2_9FUNG|nr:hypothetical protein EC957_001876 [Mortierella hygrophila]
MSALTSSSSSNGNSHSNKRGAYDLSSGSSNSSPSTTSAFTSSSYNNNKASSSSSPAASASTSSGFQRTPVHATIPKPKKYIGHYDIADRTFQLLSRHRAAACILFWSLTILLDILLQLPIEWFFLFYFILALVFRIFFIGGPIVLISIGAMCLANAFVFYTVPFSFTSPFATGVAFGLMVSLIHGLNLKGVILAMTMYMLKPYLERQTLIAALNPPTVPSIVFLAPLAAFCSAFGVLWLLYDLFGYLHASTDDLRDFFGITLPAPSLVTLKEVKDRSITLNWQCSSQATISKHLIEIDGLLIGESGKQETSVVIQGLYPDNTYRIRLWAITTRNWKTPSDYVVVRTLASVPIELELSSVESARRESELAKKSIEENKDPQHTTKVQDLENSTASQEDSASTEKSETTAPAQDPRSLFSKGNTSASSLSSSVTATASANINNNNTPTSPPSATVHVIASTEQVAAIPTAAVVTDEQIAALRIELEEKESSHVLLNQQFSNLEKQYKQQEENLKNEIAALREQQKQEDEPRQHAKTKLKELQDSLREAEVNKSKVEKEHRMEVDRRQRIAGQLEAKQKKVENLQQTLKQSEEKLKAEKESHRKQRIELEANLKKRQEEVVATESSLKALQASQKTLCSTIEAKEAELSQLQATLQSPKEYLIWEQKSKDLDVKCALLAEEVAQYKQENQQLQERLAEATKNVTKVRAAHDRRKAQAELRKANARVSPDEGHATAASPLPELQHQGHGSSWMNAGWNQSPGTKFLNGLFQDDPALPDVRPSSARKMTGPPPGLTRRDSSPLDPGLALMMDGVLSGYGRDGKETGLQGAIGTSGSPSMINSQAIVGPPKSQQRLKSGWGARPRSSSIMSSEYLLVDGGSGSSSSSASATTVPGAGTNVFGEESSDPRQGTRSRTSSISSFNGFQSPLFDSPFAFSNHAYQSHQDTNASNQPYQQYQQNRQSTLHNGPQKPQTHGVSPRTRFQGIGSSHSPPIPHTPSPWGAAGSSALKNVSGPIAAPVGAGSRSPLVDLDTKGSTNATSSPTFNYHNFFGPSSTSTDTLGYEGNSSLNNHQMNEQNVIKSMFESPDTLDLRHHLRTVGSHSSLGTQAKILPSHLRSISTPGTSSPLSSPTTATHTPFQHWDHRVIGRPGSLGRMNSQAEGSSSSLNISDTSSPTSPHGATSFSQSNASSGFGPRKTLPADRGFWGGPGTGSGYGGVSMENGILPSPTGSSGSSLDMGTPLPVDAHAFADQYFSNRGHRGYETPSSLSSAGFLSSLKHPLSTSSAADNTGAPKASSVAPGLGYSQQNHNQGQSQGYGHGFGQGSRTLQQSTSGSALGSTNNATTGGSEADVFGYGLQFNPFEWTMPTGGFDDRSTSTFTEEQQQQHDKDKLHGGL